MTNVMKCEIRKVTKILKKVKIIFFYFPSAFKTKLKKLMKKNNKNIPNSPQLLSPIFVRP